MMSALKQSGEHLVQVTNQAKQYTASYDSASKGSL